MRNRITPTVVKQLTDKQIFGFGSNLQGVHGAGAAKMAVQWGAKRGVGFGLRGQTYAIPTRDYKGFNPTTHKHEFENLPLDVIKVSVEQYIFDCKLYGELQFLTTAIGCGHAGYTAQEIAPLFENAIGISNIWLPLEFWNVLGGVKG